MAHVVMVGLSHALTAPYLRGTAARILLSMPCVPCAIPGQSLHHHVAHDGTFSNRDYRADVYGVCTTFSGPSMVRDRRCGFGFCGLFREI